MSLTTPVAGSVSDGQEPLPSTPFPIFRTVADYRAWRQRAFDAHQSVGFVPTMGALHDGHLSLVKRSLAENDSTVVSIFVNPTQFGPNEDLASYPRTLTRDLSLLSALAHPASQPTSTNPPSSQLALFLPTAHEMYPSGPDPSLSSSTSLALPSLSHTLEGTSRPHFFRGVLTVVLKLFSALLPTRAYFGQKDIQQALILRRMTRDLLLAYPDWTQVRIVRTEREEDGLAMSSRNVRLRPAERAVAPVLFQALSRAEEGWATGESKDECIAAALDLIASSTASAVQDGVSVRLDYVEMSDAETLQTLSDDATQLELDHQETGERPVVLSGAMWVGDVRLIDNIVLGDDAGSIVDSGSKQSRTEGAEFLSAIVTDALLPL